MVRHVTKNRLLAAAAAVGLVVAAGAVGAPAVAGAPGKPGIPVNVSAAALVTLPDSAQSSAPEILDGVAAGFEDRGQGVWVFASALPSEQVLDAMQPGDTTNNFPLARGVVDGQGRFALRADLGSLPADYVGPHGQVDVVIVTWDGRKQGQTTASTFRTPTAERGKPSVSVTADEEQVSQAGAEFGKPWLECSETLLSRGYLRNASIGESLTPDRSQTAWMTYKNSQSVSLGVAIDMSNDTVGFKASGSVSRSSSFSASWDPSASNRSYLLQAELGKYKETCYTVTSGSKTYAYTKTSYRAIKLTGGYSNGSASSFSAPYCTGPIAAGTWTRNSSSGSAYSFGAGFDISNLVGFDVTSTSNYDTSNALTYKQPTDYKYQLCGSNDFPADASRIRGYFA